MSAVEMQAKREHGLQLNFHQGVGAARVLCGGFHINGVGAPVIVLAAQWGDEAVDLGHDAFSCAGTAGL